MNKRYAVDVVLGGGADTDNIATYLVHAESEEEAEATALGYVELNARANLIRNPKYVSELDYDGVLGEESGEIVLIYDTVVNVHVEDGHVTSVHVDDENLRFNSDLTTANNPDSLEAIDAAIDTVDTVEWPAWDFGY